MDGQSNYRVVSPTFQIVSPHSEKTTQRIIQQSVDYVPTVPGLVDKGYVPTKEDLMSRRITIKSGGDKYVTFFNGRFFPETQEEPKGRVAAFIPDSRTSDPNQRQGIVGEVVNTKEPILWEHLRQMINAGAVPQGFSSVHFSVDLTVSLFTAMEFGCQRFRLVPSSVMEMMAFEKDVLEWKAGDEIQIEPIFQGIPISKSVAGADKHGEKISKALEQVNQIYRWLRNETEEAVAQCVLPLSHMCEATVTKSLIEWRSFFTTDSQTLETAQVKVNLYKHFLRHADPLFHGCGNCVNQLKAMRKVFQ